MRLWLRVPASLRGRACATTGPARVATWGSPYGRRCNTAPLMRRHFWLLPVALLTAACPNSASAATIGRPFTLLDAGKFETVLQPTLVPGPSGFDVLGTQWGIQGSRPVVATKLDEAGMRAPGTMVGTSGSQGPAARLTYVAAARLASGDVLAAWVDDQRRLVARPLSGEVEEVVDGEGPTLDPHVATDAVGNALMTWSTGTPYARRLVATVRRADGRYEDRIELDRDVRSSAIAMDAAGAAIVVWANDDTQRLRLRTRAADGTWGPTADLGSISGETPRSAWTSTLPPAAGGSRG